jgi:ammonium transporter Rh
MLVKLIGVSQTSLLLLLLLLLLCCRRYGKSAVGLNFFCSCLVMLVAVLLIGAVQQGLGHGHTSIKLELPLLVDATFCAGSAMIAFGAVLGKTTPTQLTWLMVGLVSVGEVVKVLVTK